jgi:hypothetical protein
MYFNINRKQGICILKKNIYIFIYMYISLGIRKHFIKKFKKKK